MYTLDELQNAKAELENWLRKFDNYSGNNPDKYRTQIRDAREKVRVITEYLKGAGVLERSDAEILALELDRSFPNAKNRDVVEFQGKRYERRFTPAEYSRTGKSVTRWERQWVLVGTV